MTKKDYIVIAAILRQHAATPDLIRAFARALAADNARFDADRFTAAATQE